VSFDPVPDKNKRQQRSMSMKRFVTLVIIACALAGLGAFSAAGQPAANVQPAEPAESGPSEGFDLHVDAKLHFPGDGAATAHHYCKPVAGGMIQCLLFASEARDARLVGVEVIIDAETWAAFPVEEQTLWHFHGEEIPVVEATMPDLSAAEAAPIVEELLKTYGKLYLLWDPTVEDQPVGEPLLSLFHQMHDGQ
jgi:hypothetical protein